MPLILDISAAIVLTDAATSSRNIAIGFIPGVARSDIFDAILTPNAVTSS